MIKESNMTQPTGTGQQSGTVPGQQSGQGTPDPTGTPAPTTDPSQQSGTPDPNVAKVYTQADIDAAAAKVAQADRRAQAAEKKIADAEAAQLTEAQKIQKENETLKAEVAAERERNQQQALENAVLLDQTYTWHNNANVLKLIDRESITFDDKGKPQGVKAALDKLAKDEPHLLKPKEGTGGDDGKGKPGSTGVAGGARPAGQPNDKTRWDNKFPAMRGRVGG
jgi:hypothetical protein